MMVYTRILKLRLIREGLKKDNSIILLVDTDKDEVSCMDDTEEHIFKHVTGKKKESIDEIQDTYAKMFNLHSLNVLGLDENFETVFLYKLDGTTKEYTA